MRRITGTLHKTNLHLWSYLAQFYLDLEMYQTKAAEKIKHKLYIQYLFLEKKLPFMR